MAYTATVLPIMLASPGDVSEERQAVREALHEWNYIHSLKTNIVLMPVGWETHSAPDLAGRAQELINERVLADCDLLIGVFWTRLGTPTGKSASGTVEEIERHLEDGKPAMVYFSTQPVAPQSLDPTQFEALRQFRSWCETRGLVETYENVNDFKAKLARQLQIQLAKNPYLKGLMELAGGNHSGPVHIAETRQIDFSGHAKQLLIEASKSATGQIIKIVRMGGRFFQVNSKKFGLADDVREFARWEHGFEQLLNAGLIVARNEHTFEVTEAGYCLSEQLGGELTE